MYDAVTIPPGKSAALSDETLVRRFEAATLTTDEFGHADHVRLAWCYLRQLPLLEAIRRCRAALRNFATVHDKPGLYHETVTWAYMVLIHERLRSTGFDVPWAEFAARNPDLLAWKGGAFFDYYDEDVLTSDAAREAFVLPPRRPEGPTASGDDSAGADLGGAHAQGR